ncbi:MAG: glycosyltransferase [Gammaproteobacteria bacterium]|nr:glycosyltransferase [Gammaproteobacteria bacterium]
MRERGIDLAVVSPRASRGRDTFAAAGLPMVDIELGRGWHTVRALRRELRRGRYDILHVFSGRALQNGLLASVGLPVRIVAYRGIVGNVSFADPVSWLRFLNPRIARIICVADAVRDFFLRMRPAFLRVPEERLVTIHKGHSLDWYREPAADLASAGIPPDAFVVGCVANYRPRKGIELLVDAVARLPESWNVHLLLVGDMEAARLAQAIERSGAAARVHRTGYRPDAPALAAACDVFVLPSTRREGLARSLIEAMAYGVAPVVTDCGGSPELVVDGVSGLIVPPGDAAALAEAIAKLHEDPQLRLRFGAAARERIARDFRIEDTIERTIDVYREVVAE